MPTLAIAAFGTLLQLGNGATPTESFTTIAEVKDISGPALSSDTEDVTNHDSTDGWGEIIPTILRAGEVTFDVNFIPTGTTQSYSAGLIKDLKDQTKRNFQIVFPDTTTTTWGFAAYVTGFEPSAPVAGGLSASVTLSISGKPSLE